jgi:hypothetical protein
MGYTTSTVHGIEVPNSSEANDVPEDIGKVVTALEGGSLVKRLTSAQIAALSSPQKPSGLVVFNTTTGKLQISDGTNFARHGRFTSGRPAQATACRRPAEGGRRRDLATLNLGASTCRSRSVQSGASNVTRRSGQARSMQCRTACPRVAGRWSPSTAAATRRSRTAGGSAPTWAQLTVESPFSVFPHLMSISSTVLNVRASSLSGIITSDSVYMHWLVGV